MVFSSGSRITMLLGSISYFDMFDKLRYESCMRLIWEGNVILSWIHACEESREDIAAIAVFC